MGTSFNPNQLYPLIRCTNFNWKYSGRWAILGQLANYLNGIQTTEVFGKLFSNPQEYIVSVKAYPFDLKKLSVSPGLNAEIQIGIEEHTGVTATDLGVIKPSLNMGIKKIDPIYNSYLDYAPYTKITVFLPYVGFIELDTNEVMNHTLSFDYAIDLDSGELTAVISNIDNLTYDEYGNPQGSFVIKTATGKIGIDVPLGATNAREIYKQFVTSMIGMVGGATSYTSGKGIASGITKTTTSMFNALQQHYHKGSGSIQGLNNLPLPQSIYIIREMNSIITDPKDYKGKPVEMTGTLSDYHGFTSIDSYGTDIDLSFATKDEADELKSLLQSGVYLP